MKLSKILSKRVLSLLIVGLFVFTAFVVIQSGGGQAQESPSGSSSFTFPYQYGTPTVPSDVGAQGIQGPITHPISTVLGVHTHAGQGFSFNFFNPPTVTITFDVFNGTKQSNTVAVHQEVQLLNTTLGNTYTQFTNSTGIAVFSIPAGFYQYTVTASNASKYSTFVYSEYLMSSQTVNIYLLPVSLSEVNIHNGGSDLVNFWMTTPIHSSITGYADALNVTLLNASSSDTPLGTAVTFVNGSFEFQNVNSTFSYELQIDGYSQYHNGMIYGLNNLTTGSASLTTIQSYHIHLNAENGGTATVKNIASPSSDFGAISSSIPSVVENGTYFMRNAFDGGGTLYVNHTVFVMQSAYGRATDFNKVFFNNSVLIWDYAEYTFINPGQVFDLNNTTIYFSNSYSPLYPGFTWETCNIHTSSSVIYFDGSSENRFGGNVSINETDFYSYYNDGLNIYGSSYDNAFFYNDNIYNSTITLQSPDKNFVFKNDYMDNVSMGCTQTSAFPLISGSVVDVHNLPITDSFQLCVNNIINSSINIFDTPIFHSGVLIAQNIQNTSISANNNIIDSGVNRGLLYDNVPSLTLKYSLVEGLVSFQTSGSNSVIENNIFTNQSAIGTAQLGINYNDGNAPVKNITVANNTFGPVWANESAYNFLMSSGGGSTELVVGYNYPVYNFTLTYNTFYTAPVFGGGAGSAQVIYADGGNISYNLFYDNESYGTNAYQLNMDSQVIAIANNNDNHYTTSINITNNYFLNLNNETLPIGNINYGAANITARITGNHFFYNPIISYKGIKPLHPFSVKVGDGLSYLMQDTNNNTYINNPQYIYYNGQSLAPLNLVSTKEYVITPDVEILTGTPTISYSNGLVGGPQPNFIWKGYDYSESVEPTYIQVGVNSSKAPSIGLQFQGIAGALYDIEMFNNGSLISSYQESATSSGVLNATYNPATMPLDPIFYVEYVGSGVVPPPVVPPLVPTVPHVLFGIPYLNVIVLFGGIALASEEFFRTQAKGKEKKYSYTGIFVGIMIAGIGLMSVL